MPHLQRVTGCSPPSTEVVVPSPPVVDVDGRVVVVGAWVVVVVVGAWVVVVVGWI